MMDFFELAEEIRMSRTLAYLLAALLPLPPAFAQPMVLTCFLAKEDPLYWLAEGQPIGPFELDLEAMTFTHQTQQLQARVVFNDWDVVVIQTVQPVSEDLALSGLWILNQINWHWRAVSLEHDDASSREGVLSATKGYCEAVPLD